MKEIKLSRNFSASVDDEDYDMLSKYKWWAFRDHSDTRWYAIKKGSPIYMHRLILNPPQKLDVDHVDSNGLNNCKSNLRLATRAQNNMNQRKTRGTSRFKGVCWHREGHKWQVHIKVGMKRLYLGLFDDEVKAATAYNDYAKLHYGEYARLNPV